MKREGSPSPQVIALLQPGSKRAEHPAVKQRPSAHIAFHTRMHPAESKDLSSLMHFGGRDISVRRGVCFCHALGWFWHYKSSREAGLWKSHCSMNYFIFASKMFLRRQNWFNFWFSSLLTFCSFYDWWHYLHVLRMISDGLQMVLLKKLINF
jgi:hypothetical protein